MNFQKFTSRKFLIAFGAALFIILNEGLGLNIDKSIYNYIVGLAVTYIAAEGTADAIRARNQK